MQDSVVPEVTELLQELIRNRCVNDGTAESGHESRNASTLRSYLEGCGLSIESYEPLPGRESLLVRLEGSDPSAARLTLMGHTDVVPVNESGWSVDPFGGELIDGRIWGRGAIDMLNMTASMAVAIRHLASMPKRPRNTIHFLAVADEEAGGVHGAKYLLDNHRDDLDCDYVVTERGGVRLPSPNGVRIGVRVGEKGFARHHLTIRGTPGHASMPRGTDNAVVKAARVVSRLSELEVAPMIDQAWIDFVDRMGYDDELRRRLTTADEFDDALDSLPDGLARIAHACVRTTVVPTVIQGGTKSNVVPDLVELTVDIRTTLGQSEADVRDVLVEALGELVDDVEICADRSSMTPATRSPIDTPLWHAMQEASASLVPGAVCVPKLAAASTDASFFRALDIPSYGFALFSEQMQFDEFVQMFHGNDEWVDQESLRLTTELWLGIVDRLGSADRSP